MNPAVSNKSLRFTAPFAVKKIKARILSLGISTHFLKR